MGKVYYSFDDRMKQCINRLDNGCWIWKVGKRKDGYRDITVNGTKKLAHRVVYEHMVGPVPVDLDLDHLCRVRSCCNPTHLEPVTRQVNKQRGVEAANITACPWGHEYTKENTINQSRIRNGKVFFQRKCRWCQHLRNYNRTAFNPLPMTTGAKIVKATSANNSAPNGQG
jgi:hypothetical protein